MLSVNDLEQVFSELAEGIDAVGPQNEGLFLTKLVFVLANHVGDIGAVRDAIALARRQIN